MGHYDAFYEAAAWEAAESLIREDLAKHERWDRRFLEMAKLVSTWSKDPSTQVGAVLVNEGHVVGTGYNGFARGIADTDERYADRDIKYGLVVHAEVNSIIRAGHRAKGATLYMYPSFMLPPICGECAKVAITAGVSGIVGYEPNMEDPRVQRWVDSITVAKEMWDEVGLFVRAYPEERGEAVVLESMLELVSELVDPSMATDSDEQELRKLELELESLRRGR